MITKHRELPSECCGRSSQHDTEFYDNVTVWH